jgi:hypothetical protein
MVVAGLLASLLAQAPVVRQTAYLKASNADAADHFGNGGTLLGDSVSISGDGNTIAVGAPHEASNAAGINGNQTDDSSYNAGAVYVYIRNGNNWTQQAYIKPAHTQMSAEFGHVTALSADGNTLAVSAFFESSATKGINGDPKDASIPQAGAVYVFTRANGRWTQQAYIKASNTGEAGEGDNFGDGDQFGFSLAISDDGNTIAVGANAEDSNATGINGNQADNSMQSAGAVYVFTRNGTAWTQQAYIKASNTAGNMQFGYGVTLSADGSTLAVGGFDEAGASREINGPQARGRTGSGAVYILTRAGTTWTQQAYIKPNNVDQNDSFGAAVALSDDGNTLLAGSLDEDCMATGVNPTVNCTEDVKADTSTGAAYVFIRSGTTWTQQAFVKPSNTGANDWFGSRLAISGDGNTVVASAQLEDSNARGINGNQADNSAIEAGAAYVFRRTGTTWTQLAYVKGGNTEAFDEFASSVALSRDGQTMVAGARAEDGSAKGGPNDNSADEAGAAYVFAISR